MEHVALATTITTALAPVLPYLLKVGEKTADSAIEKFGAGAWDAAEALWSRIWSHLAGRPAAVSALNEVAATPDDDDAKAALRLQVRKLLEDHPHLAAELTPAAERLSNHVQNAQGDRNVLISGGMTGGSVSTGDVHHYRGSPEA